MKKKMDNRNMFFSIIVPFYNTKEQYFKSCITSIKNQSFKDYELIVVDNSDTKESHILAKNICLGSNIKLLTTKIIGVSNARNIGIANSRGKYIIFVDADDFLPENSLEKIYNGLVHYNYPDMIIGKNLFLKNKKYSKSKILIKGGGRLSYQNLISSIFLNNKKSLACADTPWAFFMQQRR